MLARHLPVWLWHLLPETSLCQPAPRATYLRPQHWAGRHLSSVTWGLTQLGRLDGNSGDGCFSHRLAAWRGYTLGVLSKGCGDRQTE